MTHRQKKEALATPNIDLRSKVQASVSESNSSDDEKELGG